MVSELGVVRHFAVITLTPVSSTGLALVLSRERERG